MFRMGDPEPARHSTKVSAMSERDDEQPVADTIDGLTHTLDDRMREATDQLSRIADLLYEIRDAIERRPA